MTPTSNALHANGVGVQRPKAFDLRGLQPRDAVKLDWLGPLSIAILTAAGILLRLALRYVFSAPRVWWLLPLFAVLALGGVPLVFTLSRKLVAREFGSDLLAGISIVTSVFLGEYFVGCIVVLMLSGGEALEQLAKRRASSTLDSLAKRMPQTAHRKSGEELKDASLEEIAVGDELVIFPHEICPTDGVVQQGHGKMNEAYLTGEPFEISKTPGSEVLSGSVNGEAALTVRAEKLPIHSRYARIMQVMQETEQQRPRLAAWETNLEPGTRRPRSLFLSSPGLLRESGTGFWPCWWWPPHARS